VQRRVLGPEDLSMSASPANLDATYRAIPDLLREHACERPDNLAVVAGDQALSYSELDELADRVAASLQRDAIGPGDAIAICAHSSIRYVAVFLGALRAGAAVVPLPPSIPSDVMALLLANSQARYLFADAAALPALAGQGGTTQCIALSNEVPGQAFEAWMLGEHARPAPVHLPPEAPFNIIYSSGTTGEPKGIVQPHAMRWAHVCRGAKFGYGHDTVTLLATPLYSNTTLVVLFPTLAFGGTVVLTAKFDAAQYLALAQRYRMTHTMLVPVQYQRIMSLPQFHAYDLAATRMKFCTSAPFSAQLKVDVLQRWPGGLVEFYGLTEGGGTCILAAHERPDKLHTVGRPAPGHDIRLIDDAGRELPPGATGEVVGNSPAMMMTGYHGRPDKTREAEWFDASGKRFLRTGDIGRFDDEGFLVLLDRKKDMLITGGFNVYPSDLETVLRRHSEIADAAVVGVPSRQWGETPIGFVVLRAGCTQTEAQLLQWVNARLGKVQRLARLQIVDELPRNAIGKVLKRELRERHVASGLEPT